MEVPRPPSNIEFYPKNKTNRPKGCLYLFHEKCYQDTSQPIYKVGFTGRNARDRLQQYERKTEIIYEHYLNLNRTQLRKIESVIKRYFRTKYILVEGHERFQGDIEEIKKDFIDLIEQCTQGKDVSFPNSFQDDDRFELSKHLPTQFDSNVSFKEAKAESQLYFLNHYLSSLSDEEIKLLEKDFTK
jgi:hypothetical protein